MLAINWPSHQHMYPQAFLPSVPSPLSPRSANVPSYARHMSGKAPDDQLSSEGSAQARTEYSKRTIKKAPTSTRDELKDKRRRAFLRKVQEGRENARFDRRADDILRVEFAQSQRRWEDEQIRSAPDLPSDPLEDDDSVYAALTSFQAPTSSEQVQDDDLDEFEVEEVEKDEMEDLEALLSLLPQEMDEDPATMGRDELHLTPSHNTEHFGSDDDDFDALFCTLTENNAHFTNQASVPQSSGDAMDMS